MARHLEDGHREDYCLFLIQTLPRKCTNGPVKHSKRMVTFNMKYRIGLKTSRRAEWSENQAHMVTHHRHVFTTSNTGAVSPISPSARAHTDMQTVIAIQMCCVSKHIL